MSLDSRNASVFINVPSAYASPNCWSHLPLKCLNALNDVCKLLDHYFEVALHWKVYDTNQTFCVKHSVSAVFKLARVKGGLEECPSCCLLFQCVHCPSPFLFHT